MTDFVTQQAQDHPVDAVQGCPPNVKRAPKEPPSLPEKALHGSPMHLSVGQASSARSLAGDLSVAGSSRCETMSTSTRQHPIGAENASRSASSLSGVESSDVSSDPEGHQDPLPDSESQEAQLIMTPPTQVPMHQKQQRPRRPQDVHIRVPTADEMLSMSHYDHHEAHRLYHEQAVDDPFTNMELMEDFDLLMGVRPVERDVNGRDLVELVAHRSDRPRHSQRRHHSGGRHHSHRHQAPDGMPPLNLTPSSSMVPDDVPVYQERRRHGHVARGRVSQPQMHGYDYHGVQARTMGMPQNHYPVPGATYVEPSRIQVCEPRLPAARHKSSSRRRHGSESSSRRDRHSSRHGSESQRHSSRHGSESQRHSSRHGSEQAPSSTGRRSHRSTRSKRSGRRSHDDTEMGTAPSTAGSQKLRSRETQSPPVNDPGRNRQQQEQSRRRRHRHSQRQEESHPAVTPSASQGMLSTMPIPSKICDLSSAYMHSRTQLENHQASMRPQQQEHRQRRSERSERRTSEGRHHRRRQRQAAPEEPSFEAQVAEMSKRPGGLAHLAFALAQMPEGKERDALMKQLERHKQPTRSSRRRRSKH